MDAEERSDSATGVENKTVGVRLMSADGGPGAPGTYAPRQSLVRLRGKIRARSGPNGGDGAPHTRQDLVQLEYAIAERHLEDHLRTDLADRERLTETHLDVPWQSIAVSSEYIEGPHIKPVLRLIAEQLKQNREVEFTGAKPNSPPRWDRFELGDEVELVPAWVSIYWDTGTVSNVPLVLETFDKGYQQVLQVFSRTEDHAAAKAYLDRLINDARGSRSPYRGRLLIASWSGYGVQFEIVPAPSETRDQLVFPPAIWEALDVNVHRMFARMPTFTAAGLGSNRGVLLAGAPGTGKTAACKVLAREVLGDVTAVFVDSRVGQGLLPQLYREISGMAPALVLLEDLDLLVGSRHDQSAHVALFDFLTVLDGLMTQHHDVITVATTNDPQAVDAGVRRASRFDRIVTFPLPDERARKEILGVYLRSIDHRVDIQQVAKATEGRTGADLREYVRAALLNATDSLATEDLLRVLPDGRTGQDGSEGRSRIEDKYL